MLVSPSVGEERRGIDRADERRGRAGDCSGSVAAKKESHGERGREGEGGRSGGHSLQCVHPLHSPPPLSLTP